MKLNRKRTTASKPREHNLKINERQAIMGGPAMNHRWAERLYLTFAKKNFCLAAFAAAVLLTALVWKIDIALAGTGGRGVLHLQLAFTKSTFEEIMSSWRSGGVDLLMNARWLYLFYPVVCAILFSSAQAFFSSLRKGEGPHTVSPQDFVFYSLPLAGGVAGCAAQILLILIFRSGSLSEKLVMAESIMASVSWALFIVSLVLVLRSYFLFRKKIKRAGQGL
jgi:hypothetical protein